MKKFWLAAILFTLPSLLSADPIQSLSRKLETGINKKHPISLAVLNFPYSRGRMSTGSYLVSERLITYLVQDGVTVIERGRLQDILQEKKLRETGAVDPNSIKNAGEILGVDAVVTGLLNDEDEDSTEVMARIIQVDTAKILSAASVTIPRLWKDLPRVPRFAQIQSPVPGTIDGFNNSSSEPVQRHSLGRQHYNPSAVPVFMPSSAQPWQGGSPQ